MRERGRWTWTRTRTRRVRAWRKAALVAATGFACVAVTDWAGMAGTALATEPAVAARASDIAAAAGEPRWSWPVAPVVVANAYAAPPRPYAAGHRGIDLAASPGAVVSSPSTATVRFAGVVVDRAVLTLDHGDGVLSSYEPLASELEVGAEVVAGTRLGLVSAGGHCAADCLHVGVRIDGQYVSPLLFFDRVPRAVLLPLWPAAARSATLWLRQPGAIGSASRRVLAAGRPARRATGRTTGDLPGEPPGDRRATCPVNAEDQARGCAMR